VKTLALWSYYNKAARVSISFRGSPAASREVQDRSSFGDLRRCRSRHLRKPHDVSRGTPRFVQHSVQGMRASTVKQHAIMTRGSNAWAEA
jgi:hypothetical protein